MDANVATEAFDRLPRAAPERKKPAGVPDRERDLTFHLAPVLLPLRPS